MHAVCMPVLPEIQCYISHLVGQTQGRTNHGIQLMFGTASVCLHANQSSCTPALLPQQPLYLSP